MKQLFTLMVMAGFCNIAMAQSDSKTTQNDSIRVGNMIIVKKAGKSNPAGNKTVTANSDTSAIPATGSDSIRIGNMVIVTNGEKKYASSGDQSEDRYEEKHKKNNANVSTNWIILDFGFGNYIDKTNYPTAGVYAYNRPGAAPLGASDFDLNTGKSINVNIWLFMQRLNLIQHHLNLKYGLGVELNNYRYKSQLSYREVNPFEPAATPAPAVFRDSIVFTKNKLAADYVTVPVMLNFCTNTYSQHKGFSISLGISAGYLYSQRNKQISEIRGKQTSHGGYDLKQFKFAYIGEISLGPVRLYGSYSPSSFYKRELDLRPYSLGIRLSNW